MTPDGLFGLLSSVSCGAFVLATDQTVVFWNRRAREILGYTPDRVVGQRCSGIARGLEDVPLTGDCEEGCLMVRSLRAGLVPSRARLRMRCAWGELKWLVVTPMVVSGVEDGGPLLVYLFGDSGEEAVSADVQRLVELGGGAGHRLDQVPPLVMSAGPGPGQEESEPNDRYLAVPNSEPGSGGEGEGTFDAAETLRRTLAARLSELGEEQDGGTPDRSSDFRTSEVNLTAREREVLSYLALGWETRYIAEELGMSWYTARNHIENLRRKLGASSRLEAVMVAMRLGIIP